MVTDPTIDAADCCVKFAEAIIDEFLIKVYCESKHFEFLFYSFNIYIMQSLLF